MAGLCRYFRAFSGTSGAISHVVNTLPDSAKRELLSHIHEHVVRTNPLFRICRDPAFISSIVMCLKSSRFVPGDVIIRIGDIGSQMYFLVEGSVNVYTSEGKLVKTFNSGRFAPPVLLTSAAHSHPHACYTFVRSYSFMHA
jgi:hypothetical protein